MHQLARQPFPTTQIPTRLKATPLFFLISCHKTPVKRRVDLACANFFISRLTPLFKSGILITATRRYLSWIEGLTTNQNVTGSNPVRRTIEIKEESRKRLFFFVQRRIPLPVLRHLGFGTRRIYPGKPLKLAPQPLGEEYSKAIP